MTARLRKIKACLELIGERGLVPAEVLSYSDPAAMIHDRQFETISRQECARMNGGRRPKVLEARAEKTVVIDASEWNFFTGTPHGPADIFELGAKLGQGHTVAILQGTSLRHSLPQQIRSPVDIHLPNVADPVTE
jgi:hypothetical protein